MSKTDHTSQKVYLTDYLYTDGKLLEGFAFVVEEGRIAKLCSKDQLSEEETKCAKYFKDTLVIPGLVNSHNHSFQSLLKGFCDDENFFTWRDEALYKYSKVLSEEDIYNGALFAFAEMLKAGITTVCDFFYINDQDNNNARAVIKAANDLGIRIVMARTMYDWDGAPERFRETLDQAVTNTEALMSEFKDQPSVSVLPAPHSLHGASVEMIHAGNELSEKHGTKYHMHIAEGEYERQMMEEKHGASPIRFLKNEGLLNARLVGIHCVWLDDDEIQMMADCKTGLSYNPSSNMFLGDGITRIHDMHAAGVVISLGTDGGCSNNRSSIIEEMRMTSLLQKVHYCDSTVTRAEDMLVMGTENGGLNLNLPVGSLKEGAHADFCVVDLHDLSMQPEQNMIKNLVYASQPQAIKRVYVGGQKVCKNTQLTNVDEREIYQRVKQTCSEWTAPKKVCAP